MSTIVLGGPPPDGSIPTPDYGVPAYELIDAAAAPAEHDRRRGARAAADPRPHARVGPRARRPGAAGRGRARGARDQLHEGVLSRARSPSPASTTAAIRTAACACSSSKVASCPPTTPSSASTGRPSAGSRAPSPTATACSRSPTCGARFPTTPSSLTARGRRHSYTHPPRARSSGDRALPCGGRGRTFESCRAHQPTNGGPLMSAACVHAGRFAAKSPGGRRPEYALAGRHLKGRRFRAQRLEGPRTRAPGHRRPTPKSRPVRKASADLGSTRSMRRRRTCRGPARPTARASCASESATGSATSEST